MAVYVKQPWCNNCAKIMLYTKIMINFTTLYSQHEGWGRSPAQPENLSFNASTCAWKTVSFRRPEGKWTLRNRPESPSSRGAADLHLEVGIGLPPPSLRVSLNRKKRPEAPHLQSCHEGRRRSLPVPQMRTSIPTPPKHLSQSPRPWPSGLDTSVFGNTEVAKREKVHTYPALVTQRSLAVPN